MVSLPNLFRCFPIRFKIFSWRWYSNPKEKTTHDGYDTTTASFFCSDTLFDLNVIGAEN